MPTTKREALDWLRSLSDEFEGHLGKTKEVHGKMADAVVMVSSLPLAIRPSYTEMAEAIGRSRTRVGDYVNDPRKREFEFRGEAGRGAE